MMELDWSCENMYGKPVAVTWGTANDVYNLCADELGQ